MKKDPIVEQVIEKFKARSALGIAKYGTTLAENNSDDFLTHLQEELMDAILYIQKLRDNKPTMTLIDQLRKSPKWEEFQNWFFKQQYQDDRKSRWWNIGLYDEIVGGGSVFIELPFEFQKGVFERFIYECPTQVFKQYSFVDTYGQNNFTLYMPGKKKSFHKSYEELLIHFFNN